jgi:hypothetical protein
MSPTWEELSNALDEGRALYSPEQVELFDDRAYITLTSKLEQVARSGAFSGKMIAMVGRIIGKAWTQPEIAGLSITSDGMLVEGFGGILGDADSFDRNLKIFVDQADLDESEMALMRSLANTAVNRFDGKVTLGEDAPEVEL